MRKIIWLLIALPITVLSQKEIEIDTLQNNVDNLSDVVIYANKFPELRKYIAQSVKVIKDKASLNNQANTGDILINTGTLFVQKSQQGGSSPVIRGFEASRVLLMVDGIRMNNAIYRSGHLQNIITVDNMILDRLEVLYGPSSTLYGSDALGGVVSMFTKNPLLSTTNKTVIKGSAALRYSSAINEERGHFNINIGGKQWASLTSVTYGSFGDMVQGNQRSSQYPTFGLKKFIVKRVGNTDSAFVNPNPNKQSPSDYKQIDLTQKFLYQPNKNIQHLLNLQYSTTSNLHRYDRLSENNAGVPVFAEWYYGPQLRKLAAYQLNVQNQPGFFKELKLTANIQDIEESRITRRFKSNNKDFRWERVNIFGINADAKHYYNKHELHVGFESYFNFVRSTAERKNIVTNAISRITTRYSDGPTKMEYHALYAQHTYRINNKLTLNDGIRLNAVNLNAVFADTTLMHFPFKSIQQNNLALTGNVGLIYHPNDKLRAAIVASSGFRAPNVDDASKVFDTQTGYVVVPNNNIKPEYTYNAEANINYSNNTLSIGAALFYTWFNNAIVVDKFKFNGQDSIIYQNIKSAVFAPQNKARAYVYGFSVNAAYTFAKNTTVEAVGTYTYGRYNNAGITMPLDHIPPFYGRTAIKHGAKKWIAEIFALFNGWKRLKDYNTNGEDNLQYATADGMPAWLTFNCRAGFNWGKHISAQITLENILDRNYRYFASGISAPGRNLSITLKSSF